MDYIPVYVRFLLLSDLAMVLDMVACDLNQAAELTLKSPRMKKSGEIYHYYESTRYR